MELLVSSRLPSEWGEYEIAAFGKEGDRFPHVVLHRGIEANKADGTPVPVRIHSECMTGDVFASRRCDCGEQLHTALTHFKEQGGMLIYLRQEGRGIGLVDKLKAYNLQDDGMNTFEANEAMGHGADERSYAEAVAILSHYGVNRIELLTNNPDKSAAMQQGGIEIAKRMAINGVRNADNAAYLQAKREITGHFY